MAEDSRTSQAVHNQAENMKVEEKVSNHKKPQAHKEGQKKEHKPIPKRLFLIYLAFYLHF